MRYRPALAPLRLALAAAIAALAGCQAAPPESSTQVIAPLPFGNAAPTGEAHPLTLTGQATLGGQPLAGARLSVLDAVTDEPMTVIAPGGGNVVASGGANLATGADGSFRLELADVPTGRAVRVIAETDAQQVMTLVSGDGQSLAPGAHVLASGLAISVAMSELTTSLTYMSAGAFHMLSLLRPDAADSLIKTTLLKLRERAPDLVAYLAANPSLVQALASRGALGGDGLPAAAGAALAQVLAGTGGLQPWLDLNRDTITQLVAAVRTRGSLSPDLLQRLSRLKDMPLAGTGLKVSLDEHNLTVASTAGQVLAVVDLTDTARLDAAIHDPTFQQIFQVVATAAGDDGKKK